MKQYEPAQIEVLELIAARREKFYPELDKASVTLTCLMVTNDTGPALTLHGVTAGAVIRIVGQKDRAKGCADSEMTIDEVFWGGLDNEEKPRSLTTS